MSLDFWIQNLSEKRLNALEARWASALTQSQLANPWQQVVIQGTRVPGVCMLRSVKRELKFQKNKAAGEDGETITLRGLENPQFELEIHIYTPSQLDSWLKMAKSLDLFGDPQKREVKQIEHPLCNLSGVKYVLAVKIEYRIPEAGGPLVVVLGLVGYGVRPGVSSTKRPKPKAVPTAVPTVPLDPPTSPPAVQQFVRPPAAGR